MINISTYERKGWNWGLAHTCWAFACSTLSHASAPATYKEVFHQGRNLLNLYIDCVDVLKVGFCFLKEFVYLNNWELHSFHHILSVTTIFLPYET